MEIVLKGVDPRTFNLVASLVAELLQLAGAFSLCSLLALLVSLYMRNGNKIPTKALGPLPDGIIAAWQYARALKWAWPATLALFLFLSDYSTAIAFAGLDFVDIDARGEEAPVFNLTTRNHEFPYEALGDPDLPYTGSQLAQLLGPSRNMLSSQEQSEMLKLAQEERVVSSFLGAADSIARGESVFLELNRNIMDSPVLLAGQEDKGIFENLTDSTAVFGKNMHLTAINLTIPMDCEGDDMVMVVEQRGLEGQGLKAASQAPNCTFTSTRSSGIYDNTLLNAVITAYARVGSGMDAQLYFEGQQSSPIQDGSTFIFPHNGLPLAWERKKFREGRSVFGFGGVKLGNSVIPFGVTLVSAGQVVANTPSGLSPNSPAREYTLISQVKDGETNCPEDPSGSEKSDCMVTATITCERFTSEIGSGKMVFDNPDVFDRVCIFNGDVEIIWGENYHVDHELLSVVVGLRTRNIGWALSRRQRTMLSIHSPLAALFALGSLDSSQSIKKVRSTTITGLFIAFMCVPAILCVIAGCVYLLALKYLLPLPQDGSSLIELAQKQGTQFKECPSTYLVWNGRSFIMDAKHRQVNNESPEITDSQQTEGKKEYFQNQQVPTEEIVFFADDNCNEKACVNTTARIGSGFFGITFEQGQSPTLVGKHKTSKDTPGVRDVARNDCERASSGNNLGGTCSSLTAQHVELCDPSGSPHKLSGDQIENNADEGPNQYFSSFKVANSGTMLIGCMGFCITMGIAGVTFINSTRADTADTPNHNLYDHNLTLHHPEPTATMPECFENKFQLGAAIWGYVFGEEEHRNQTISEYGLMEEWCVNFVDDFSFLFSSFKEELHFNISMWNVSSVTHFSFMCAGASNFNWDLSLWNVSSGVDFSFMFSGATSFNTDVSLWDVSSGSDFSSMFYKAEHFNGDLSEWDVSSGTHFGSMFLEANMFNSNFSLWDVSSGLDFSRMFEEAHRFNSDLSRWDVSSGTNFSSMFESVTYFNSDLSIWDVSSGTDFESMFRLASRFNSNLSNWDVSSGTNFELMFYYAQSFASDLSDWDVSSGIDFSAMFFGSSVFNCDLSQWNVSSGVDFGHIFKFASIFNSDISQWDVSSGDRFSSMFHGAKRFNTNISGWDVSSGIEFDWMFYLATEFNSDVSEWDVSSGSNFRSMFARTEVFNADLSDWDVSSGTDFRSMFSDTTSFTSDLSQWNVSSGTDFSSMFSDTTVFNSNLSKWDVSSGTDFGNMFFRATNFNSNLSQWNVSSGTNFGKMFYGASSFNSDLSQWNVSSGTYFRWMFSHASSFNQDLCSWLDQLFPKTNREHNMFPDSGCPRTDASPGYMCHACSPAPSAPVNSPIASPIY